MNKLKSKTTLGLGGLLLVAASVFGGVSGANAATTPSLASSGVTLGSIGGTVGAGDGTVTTQGMNVCKTVYKYRAKSWCISFRPGMPDCQERYAVTTCTRY